MSEPIADRNGSPQRGAWAKPSAFRNVFACLVHERPECVLDLVRNLRHLDPTSAILLYNGGTDPRLLDGPHPFGRHDCIVHPHPRPLEWGRLHDFALDCMQFAIDTIPFDALTIVDSDQLAMRPGYSALLTRTLADRPGVGVLGNAPGRMPTETPMMPTSTAYRERDLWRPWLRQFPDGEDRFVHWSFWPSTVFTAAAARALTDRFARDRQLAEILAASQIVATEEVILPTLTALLGFEVAASPCSYDFNRFRVPYSLAQIASALARPDVFWAHPIARFLDDPLRHTIRAHHGDYESSPRLAPACRPLVDDPAGFLIELARRALELADRPIAWVVVGGEAGGVTTALGAVAGPAGVLLVVADDAPAGSPAPTAGLRIPREGFSGIGWGMPIGLLVLDGPGGLAGLARDFADLAHRLAPGGIVVIRESAGDPGADAFLREAVCSGRYRMEGRAGDLVAIRRLVGWASAAPPT